MADTLLWTGLVGWVWAGPGEVVTRSGQPLNLTRVAPKVVHRRFVEDARAAEVGRAVRRRLRGAAGEAADAFRDHGFGQIPPGSSTTAGGDRPTTAGS